MRVVLACVLLAGCVTSYGISKNDTDVDVTVDTDLADTDVVVDTDPADTGDGSLRCRRPVVVHNGGNVTLDSFAVHVDVPAFPGLAADLSNLSFWTAAAERQFHWVDAASGGSGTVWVRIDSLPPGDTTIFADACDATRDDLGDPRRIFPLYETWDGGALAPWTAACENVDAFDESCEAVVGTTDAGETALHLTSRTSCYTEPYNGAGATAGRAVTLPVGTWELSYRSLLAGEHYGFCSGGTNAASDAYTGGSAITAYSCSMSACGTCALPWTTVTSRLITGDGTAKPILLTVKSGDCATADAWIDDVWVRQVATPEPTVVFSP